MIGEYTMILTNKQKELIKNTSGLKELIENNNFKTLEEINGNFKDNNTIGFLYRFSLSGYKFIVKDETVYGIEPTKSNPDKVKNIEVLVKFDNSKTQDMLKLVTPYELVDSYNIISDIGSICINRLLIHVGDDGFKKVEIRKDLSHSDRPFPIPKASCYLPSQRLEAIDKKITLSMYDCEIDDEKTYTDVICVWLCGCDKIYIYVK